jgi:hypothetical protein
MTVGSGGLPLPTLPERVFGGVCTGGGRPPPTALIHPPDHWRAGGVAIIGGERVGSDALRAPGTTWDEEDVDADPDDVDADANAELGATGTGRPKAALTCAAAPAAASVLSSYGDVPPSGFRDVSCCVMSSMYVGQRSFDMAPGCGAYRATRGADVGGIWWMPGLELEGGVGGEPM